MQETLTMHKDKLVLIDTEELKELIESTILRVLNTQSQAKETNQHAYLNVEAASTYLNIAKQTLYGLTSKKAIPFIKKNKKLYFIKEELRIWLEDGRIKNTLHPGSVNLLKRPPIYRVKRSNTS